MVGGIGLGSVHSADDRREISLQPPVFNCPPYWRHWWGNAAEERH